MTISSQSTGLLKQAMTDATGTYRVLDLPPGDYTIVVSAAGFKPLKVANVPVALGQVNAENLQMEVGTATEQVTVDASAVALQTEKADVHTEISSYAIENIPLNSFRNFQGAELSDSGRVFDVRNQQQLPELLGGLAGSVVLNHFERHAGSCQYHACRRGHQPLYLVAQPYAGDTPTRFDFGSERSNRGL